MKRSEINREIRAAEEFFALHNFKLPKFASWNASDWAAQDKDEIAEIFEERLQDLYEIEELEQPAE